MKKHKKNEEKAFQEMSYASAELTRKLEKASGQKEMHIKAMADRVLRLRESGISAIGPGDDDGLLDD